MWIAQGRRNLKAITCFCKKYRVLLDILLISSFSPALLCRMMKSQRMKPLVLMEVTFPESFSWVRHPQLLCPFTAPGSSSFHLNFLLDFLFCRPQWKSPSRNHKWERKPQLQVFLYQCWSRYVASSLKCIFSEMKLWQWRKVMVL